jgi:hypothetical protein
LERELEQIRKVRPAARKIVRPLPGPRLEGAPPRITGLPKVVIKPDPEEPQRAARVKEALRRATLKPELEAIPRDRGRQSPTRPN